MVASTCRSARARRWRALELARGDEMHLEYENGTLRVENAEGLRWQLTDVAKPQFTFEYDALNVTDERALRRLGPGVQPLNEGELRQVRAFVDRLRPPPWASLQKQIAMDLRAFARGLINSVATQLEYDGLLDMMPWVPKMEHFSGAVFPELFDGALGTR